MQKPQNQKSNTSYEKHTLGSQKRERANKHAFKIYFSVAAAGLLAHFGALALTYDAIRGGIGTEGNPIFYLLGPWTSVLLFAGGMVSYYLFVWKLSIPWQMKCVSAMILTGNTSFDFAHDLSFYFDRISWPIISSLILSFHHVGFTFVTF
jgi:hypothetical protein